ncbi:MAG: class II aldolase/adducin family protein [Acutalibacteraceae bacterium]|nr:class II aldolase/adducin family protein [Acutalibacteraceae bacterium]
MYAKIKKEVYKEFINANKTTAGFSDCGIISVRDSEKNVFAFLSMTNAADKYSEEDVIVVDAEGKIVSGNESNFDERFEMHKMLYATNQNINSIVQADLRWSCIWASSGLTLPPISTLHAQNFKGEIYCTSAIDFNKGDSLYQKVGEAILNKFKYRGLKEQGAVFVRNFGAVVWGETLSATVKKACVLEELCFRTVQVRAINDEQYCYMPYELAEELYSEN